MGQRISPGVQPGDAQGDIKELFHLKDFTVQVECGFPGFVHQFLTFKKEADMHGKQPKQLQIIGIIFRLHEPGTKTDDTQKIRIYCQGHDHLDLIFCPESVKGFKCLTEIAWQRGDELRERISGKSPGIFTG